MIITFDVGYVFSSHNILCIYQSETTILNEQQAKLISLGYIDQ